MVIIFMTFVGTAIAGALVFDAGVVNPVGWVGVVYVSVVADEIVGVGEVLGVVPVTIGSDAVDSN